jgi:hypothetical protein
MLLQTPTPMIYRVKPNQVNVAPRIGLNTKHPTILDRFADVADPGLETKLKSNAAPVRRLLKDYHTSRTATFPENGYIGNRIDP